MTVINVAPVVRFATPLSTPQSLSKSKENEQILDKLGLNACKSSSDGSSVGMTRFKSASVSADQVRNEVAQNTAELLSSGAVTKDDIVNALKEQFQECSRFGMDDDTKQFLMLVLDTVIVVDNARKNHKLFQTATKQNLESLKNGSELVTLKNRKQIPILSKQEQSDLNMFKTMDLKGDNTANADCRSYIQAQKKLLLQNTNELKDLISTWEDGELEFEQMQILMAAVQGDNTDSLSILGQKNFTFKGESVAKLFSQCPDYISDVVTLLETVNINDVNANVFDLLNLADKDNVTTLNKLSTVFNLSIDSSSLVFELKDVGTNATIDSDLLDDLNYDNGVILRLPQQDGSQTYDINIKSGEQIKFSLNMRGVLEPSKFNFEGTKVILHDCEDKGKTIYSKVYAEGKLLGIELRYQKKDGNIIDIGDLSEVVTGILDTDVTMSDSEATLRATDFKVDLDNQKNQLGKLKMLFEMMAKDPLLKDFKVDLGNKFLNDLFQHMRDNDGAVALVNQFSETLTLLNGYNLESYSLENGKITIVFDQGDTKTNTELFNTLHTANTENVTVKLPESASKKKALVALINNSDYREQILALKLPDDKSLVDNIVIQDDGSLAFKEDVEFTTDFLLENYSLKQILILFDTLDSEQFKLLKDPEFQKIKQSLSRSGINLKPLDGNPEIADEKTYYDGHTVITDARAKLNFLNNLIDLVDENQDRLVKVMKGLGEVFDTEEAGRLDPPKLLGLFKKLTVENKTQWPSSLNKVLQKLFEEKEGITFCEIEDDKLTFTITKKIQLDSIKELLGDLPPAGVDSFTFNFFGFELAAGVVNNPDQIAKEGSPLKELCDLMGISTFDGLAGKIDTKTFLSEIAIQLFQQSAAPSAELLQTIGKLLSRDELQISYPQNPQLYALLCQYGDQLGLENNKVSELKDQFETNFNQNTFSEKQINNLANKKAKVKNKQDLQRIQDNQLQRCKNQLKDMAKAMFGLDDAAAQTFLESLLERDADFSNGILEGTNKELFENMPKDFQERFLENVVLIIGIDRASYKYANTVTLSDIKDGLSKFFGSAKVADYDLVSAFLQTCNNNGISQFGNLPNEQQLIDWAPKFFNLLNNPNEGDQIFGLPGCGKTATIKFLMQMTNDFSKYFDKTGSGEVKGRITTMQQNQKMLSFCSPIVNTTEDGGIKFRTAETHITDTTKANEEMTMAEAKKVLQKKQKA